MKHLNGIFEFARELYVNEFDDFIESVDKKGKLNTNETNLLKQLFNNHAILFVCVFIFMLLLATFEHVDNKFHLYIAIALIIIILKLIKIAMSMRGLVKNKLKGKIALKTKVNLEGQINKYRTITGLFFVLTIFSGFKLFFELKAINKEFITENIKHMDSYLLFLGFAMATSWAFIKRNVLEQISRN